MTNQLWRLFFETTAEGADYFGQALEEYVSAISWYEVDEARNSWIVEGTILAPHSRGPDKEFFKGILEKAASEQGCTPPLFQLEPLLETDWLEQTWKNFPPRQVGPFFIYGSHTQATPPEDTIGLEINAATAFGSGEHETTEGCLLTLDDLKKQGQTVKNPLDMGCGSGILAMAVAKLWCIPVWAVDNDPESVRVTGTNATLNGCDAFILPLCNEGFDGDPVKNEGPFDLIVANILAKPLCMMAPQMVDNLTTGGKIILSGLLRRQREEVLAAYEGVGAIFVGEKFIGDWMTLLLTK